jgi:HlyD family secretion protein
MLRQTRQGLYPLRWVILIGVLFAALAPGVGARPEEPPKKGEATFRLAKVEKGDLVKVLRIDGVLRPELTASLRPRTGGTVEKLFVREGDAVKEGQVLLQLDARAQELSLEAAKIQMNKIRAEIETADTQRRAAESNHNRVQQLLQKGGPGVVSREEIEAVRVQAETARAKVEEIKVGLPLADLAVRKAQLDLEATRLTAPFSGVVLEVGANLGELVVPGGDRIVLLASAPDRLVFRTLLDAREVQEIRPGAAIKIQNIETKVNRVAPSWRDGEEFPRVAIEAPVPNPTQTLSAFQKVTAEVPLGKLEGVLKVPAAALKWRPLPEEVDPAVREAYREFKYEPVTPTSPGLLTLLVEGRLRPIKVEVLATVGGVAAVKGPLAEGDTIVVGRKGLE